MMIEKKIKKREAQLYQLYKEKREREEEEFKKEFPNCVGCSNRDYICGRYTDYDKDCKEGG